MSEADEADRVIDQMEAALKRSQRGLLGILDDLENECELFLKPRGHWPIPGDSREASRYLFEYGKSQAVSLEPTDGSARISEALDLVVWIRLFRDMLAEDRTDLDLNYIGYLLVQFGMNAKELKFAPGRKLALSAWRSKKGGVRGNRSPWRLDPISERNESILLAARKLLAEGYERHNLASRFHRKYKDHPDFPSSIRQYQTILSR